MGHVMGTLGHWGTTVLPGVLKVQYKRVEVVWEDFPLHPTVMLDDRGTHQTIGSLGVDGNNLVIGYGDWTINTGPLKILGYDLSTLEPVTLMEQPPALSTEAWARIRIIDGKAYLPHTDPTSNQQGAYTTNETGIWETVKVGENPSMIHTFDVIRFKGRTLVCGSMSAGGGAGCVYTETEPGSREFARSLLGDIRDDFARFYKFFVHDGGNEVRVQSIRGGLETFATSDGDNWTTLTDEPTYPNNTAGDQPGPLPAGWPDPLGTRTASITHKGYVYVAGTSGRVKRARLPDAALAVH